MSAKGNCYCQISDKRRKPMNSNNNKEKISQEIIPEQIGFRISDEQYERIKENAGRFNLPVSTFLLRSAMNKLTMFCKVAEQFSIIIGEKYKYKKEDILSLEKYGGKRNKRLHFSVTVEQYNEIKKMQKIYGYDDISKYVVAKATEPYALAYDDMIEILERLQKKK